ncbi:MAG TPA: DNA internalization-related competence protein ComEC/Rec2 [Tepidiformaceae bacterium]|nr:DNA internalization-related competence protein ComEC/Rec2 [Tepidiformaceae bacterium]
MLLISLAMAWLAGLLPVGAWGAPWWMGAAWVAAACPALAMITGAARWRLCMALGGLAAASGWLLSSALAAEPPPLVAFIGQEVTIHGTIVSEPDPGEVSTSYEVRADLLSSGAETAPQAGLIRVTLHQYAAYLPGDRVELTGELELPPVFDGFDYRSYLRQRGIWATMLFPRAELTRSGPWSIERETTRMRLTLDRSLQRSLPEPEASLAGGIAFGRDGGLSTDDRDAFNRSGLRHLVAVSGSNVSLVSAVTFAMFVPWLGRRRAWLPAALTIGAYLLAAGFSASVVRAGIMAAILLGGGLVGRPQSGLPALAAAFIAMTVIEPLNALDTGFQLSMAATAGLLTVAPWLEYGLERAALAFRVPVPQVVTRVSALSLTASLCTAPIMWTTFGEISLISPASNLLVEPIFILAFWASLGAAVLGVVSEPLGSLAGIAAYYPLAFIHAVAVGAAAVPGASVTAGAGSPGRAMAAAAPIALAAGIAYRFLPPSAPLPRAFEQRRRAVTRMLVVGAGCSLVLAIIPISLLPARGPGRLTVDFLDIGQGDAILVTTPHGRQVLVDGGPSDLRLARQLGAVMPHWDRSLDALILTHPEEDHLGGLPGMARRLHIARVYDSGLTNRSATFTAFDDELPKRERLAAGDSLVIDGVTFEAVWPPADFASADRNDASVVIRISFGGVRFLLCGDIEAGAQRELLATTDVGADVIKVPHHGSRTSDPGFLQAVGAAVAVIQSGEGNRFRHPHEETLAALGDSRIVRNDLDGRVTISTDGNTVRVSTAR